MKVSHLMCCPG